MKDKTVSDIICTALETSSIAYWAQADEVVYKDDLYKSFVVSDGDPDGTGKITEGTVKINKASLTKARDKILNEDVDLHRTIAAQFVGPEDKWDYDMEGVDALIQVALYGKIVYG